VKRTKITYREVLAICAATGLAKNTVLRWSRGEPVNTSTRLVCERALMVAPQAKGGRK